MLEILAVCQADMDGGDFAVAVDQKRGRQRIHAAISLRRLIGAKDHAIVHLQIREKRLDYLPAFIIHGNAQDYETLVLIPLLKVDKPGNFNFAGTAPGGPEVQEYSLALVIRKMVDLAVGVLPRKVRRRVPVRMCPTAGTIREQTPQNQSGYDQSSRSQHNHRSLSLNRLYRQRSIFRDSGEPVLPEISKLLGQREFIMVLPSGIEPSRGITKALTAIFAPAAGTVRPVAACQRVFSPFRRPAQFALSLCGEFISQEVFIRPAPRVAQPQPCEMEY